jgi:hypothetical protein
MHRIGLLPLNIRPGTAVTVSADPLSGLSAGNAVMVAPVEQEGNLSSKISWSAVANNASNTKWRYISGNQDLNFPYLAEMLDVVTTIFAVISAT